MFVPTGHVKHFTQVHRVDGPLLVLNLKVLLWTALVPFPTAVIAEHLGEGGEPARTAVVLYGAYSSWIVRAAPAAVHGRRGRLQLALALAFVAAARPGPPWGHCPLVALTGDDD